MSEGADKKGPLITVENDDRITKSGNFLRKTRLDEIPQLFNILVGDMTFVGTRPEVEKYVNHYTDEMKATLLLPAGVTSKASLEYSEESSLVSDNVDYVYINIILDAKMKINLLELKKFSLIQELMIIINTIMFALKLKNIVF